MKGDRSSRARRTLGAALVLFTGFACLGWPSAAAEKQQERARYLFGLHCVVCHGEEGDGNGPTALSIDPQPRDFRDMRIMEERTDRQLFRVIRDGGPAEGKSVWMPPWREILSDDDIRGLVGFVRSLLPAKKPGDSPSTPGRPAGSGR